MRPLMMTTASLALLIGAAACSSTPKPEPVADTTPVVVDTTDVA